MATAGSWIEQFPGNMTWSNAALVTKGMAPYGAVALGEIDEVCERLKSRQQEPDAWPEEWCRNPGTSAACIRPPVTWQPAHLRSNRWRRRGFRRAREPESLPARQAQKRRHPALQRA